MHENSSQPQRSVPEQRPDTNRRDTRLACVGLITPRRSFDGRVQH